MDQGTTFVALDPSGDRKELSVSRDRGDVERSRRALLRGGVALAATLATRRAAPAAPPPLPEATVYTTPT
jgi:hypothetical protein